MCFSSSYLWKRWMTLPKICWSLIAVKKIILKIEFLLENFMLVGESKYEKILWQNFFTVFLGDDREYAGEYWISNGFRLNKCGREAKFYALRMVCHKFSWVIGNCGRVFFGRKFIALRCEFFYFIHFQGAQVWKPQSF